MKRLPSLVLFIFTILQLGFWTPFTSTQNPRLYAVSDFFTVLNGKEVRQQTTDDRGLPWTPKTNLNKLQLLKNDLVFHSPKDKTCFVATQKRTESEAKPSHHYFEDVHKKVGFHHVYRDYMAVRPHCEFDFIIPHHNSSKKTRLRGEFCIPEHVSGGAAVGDYDNDGLQDIYFTVFHKTSVLYKNNGDGTFTDVTGDVGLGPSRYANGAGWIDVDEDGDLDLYVTTVGDNRHYLYINYGGLFVEEAEKRNCSLQFPNKRKLAGMTPNFGDFDKDGFLDIYVSEWILHSVGKPSASRLLRNKGYEKPGYFEDVTDKVGVNMDGYRGGSTLNRGTHTFGASFTDFDEDGWPELLVTADYGDSKMFWNKLGKTFVECTENCGLKGEQDAMGHAIGDWDNDSHLDWFSTAIFHNRTDCSVSGCVFGSGGNRLYRNQGNRQFDDATDKAGVRNGGWGWGAAFIDFNNDAYLDLVMTNGVDFPSTTTDDHFQKQKMILWENLGPGYNGSTKEVSNAVGLNATGQGRGLLKFDFDDDGDEDVVVCNNLGPPQLYDNKGGNKQNWLKVRVVHSCLLFQDNLCDSYGARVQVMTSNEHLQTQEVGSNTHYLGQSEITVHFGLGSNTRNVTVKVMWPGMLAGVTVTDVQPNTKIMVVKPSLNTKQSTSFSNLTVCPSLKIIAIEKQPRHATVSINPDGQTVSFKVSPGANIRKLSTESFIYRVALVQGDNNTLLNTTTNAFVVFYFNDSNGGSDGAGECINGRRVGPKPSPTNERRFDGISNNKKNVFWGANMEDLTRDLASDYGDRLASPTGTCSVDQRKSKTCKYTNEMSGFGSNRPSPRNVSNVLFHQIESKISSRRLSDMHAHFGQFLAHDTDFSSPLPRFEFDGMLNDVWLPISVPKGDVHFDPRNRGTEYLSFVRSTYNRCTGRNHGIPRQQINKITSFIDGSSVYGDTQYRNAHLRTKKNGKMKLGQNGIIPPNSMGIANDNVVGRDASRLLVAGDTRANVQPGLIALHTLFVREHNRLCDEYLKTHPMASDEEVFQYARRIVAAELQAITFREYLPALLGGTRHLPRYQGYSDKINVGMSNIMATAAFRYGHSQVSSHLWRLNEDGAISEYGHIPVRDSYFVPERVEREGEIEPILRGAVAQPAQEIDLKMIDDLRNVLFPVGRHNGLDLAAMNIQRGRDHGLPDYNTVRKKAGLPGLKDFSDLSRDKRVAQDLKSLYGHVDNIDLWVGGLAEQHEEGSELGRTFRTIVTTNFLKIRDGDRFWYQRILDPEEIKMVDSLTLGRIIALNTEYKSAPDNVFFSKLYCASIENYQCKPRVQPSSCGNNSKEKERVEQETISSHPGERSSIFIGLTVLSLFSVIVAVIFIVLWYKQRKFLKLQNDDKVQKEMYCFPNTTVKENYEL